MRRLALAVVASLGLTLAGATESQAQYCPYDQQYGQGGYQPQAPAFPGFPGVQPQQPVFQPTGFPGGGVTGLPGFQMPTINTNVNVFVNSFNGQGNQANIQNGGGFPGVGGFPGAGGLNTNFNGVFGSFNGINNGVNLRNFP